MELLFYHSNNTNSLADKAGVEYTLQDYAFELVLEGGDQ
jgi:hypothetical protein